MHMHDYDFHAEQETVIAAKNEDARPSPPLPNWMGELVPVILKEKTNNIMTIHCKK